MPFIVQIPKKVERKLSLLPDSVIDKILPYLKFYLVTPILKILKSFKIEMAIV